MIGVGLGSAALGYALFLPIGVDSVYAVAMLPTMLLGGLGFALAYGPLNLAATNGIPAEEQGLAGGLVNTSFQFGGAVALAIVTAVNAGTTGATKSPGDLLDGFRPAIAVSLAVALLGVAATALRFRAQPVPELERA